MKKFYDDVDVTLTAGSNEYYRWFPQPVYQRTKKNRAWIDTENQIIRDNYPDNGPVFTTKVLHAAGFNDRDALSVMKQASELGVKRNKKKFYNRIGGGSYKNKI